MMLLKGYCFALRLQAVRYLLLLIRFLNDKGQEMTEADTQRLNTVRETVARISQHWLLSEIRETETSSHYIRNIEILRCLMQNGMIYARSSCSYTL
jgi:hypothetical protein